MLEINANELMNRFRQPGGSDWVGLVNNILWSTCWQVGIPESEVRTCLRTEIPDGGVDTQVRPSRHFWRVQLVAHNAGQAQRFLGAFWERHKLPVPLPLDTREGESAVAYMAVDARVLELIRERKFRELLSYKPSFSGILSANGPGYRSIFQLDSYGVLRGLVVGDLPQTIDLDAEQDTV